MIIVVMMTLARWDDRGEQMNQQEADQDVAETYLLMFSLFCYPLGVSWVDGYWSLVFMEDAEDIMDWEEKYFASIES